MNKSSVIFVAGHRGMVGSAICRKLANDGFKNVLSRSSGDLDLRDQAAVNDFFSTNKVDVVILAAAKVGGIQANNLYRAEFIYDNLMIEANVIHAAWKYGVGRLLFLGSSCIYPRDCPQPIREEYLLTGKLEKTNEPYAISKICGIQLCDAYNCQYGTKFVSLMPTNLYGPNDNYDLANSHVLPALIRKTHEAKVSNAASITVWGTGTPRREFLHVDDLADACAFMLSRDEIESGMFNIGTGVDRTISEIAALVADIIGFNGSVNLDASKPDGTPRKLLDVSKMKALGWQAKISLEAGIANAYADFLSNDYLRR
jgi:GDP-L-fucose synthase